MEKLQLISAVDFGHSSATADSGLYVGPITPGHYHLPWPLKVGQGILQGIEQAHAPASNAFTLLGTVFPQVCAKRNVRSRAW
jgi:hypothetical protein